MKSLLNHVVDDSSSDDEDNFFSVSTEIICTHYRSLDTPKHDGSIPGHRVVHRKREIGH
jgi:hypothetical protein